MPRAPSKLASASGREAQPHLQAEEHRLEDQRREQELRQAEEAIDAKEAVLVRDTPASALHLMQHGARAGGETVDAVIQARWQCLAQERSALAAKWACLAAEKQSRVDKERLVLQAALLAGPPLQQQVNRDATEADALVRGLASLGALPELPTLQHTWCAIWSVQQIQWVSLGQQQQQTDSPFASCCFQR